MSESTPYIFVDQHMVDGVKIIERREEYITRDKKLQANIDSTCIGGIDFDGKKLYFNINEEELLDEDEDVCMVDIRGSLHHGHLAVITSQDVGVEEGSMLDSTQHLCSQLKERDG